MQISVNGRHMEVTESLRKYAEERFGKLEKYLPPASQATITLAVVRKVHHIAEASIKANGLMIQASEETGEMYSSLDLLLEKIERRVRKYKEKLVNHKNGALRTEAAPPAGEDADDRIPRIIRTKRFDLKPMAPEEAVMQMELLDKPFFVFANAGSGLVSVIYRRRDGNVGLIEPAQ